MNGETWQSLEDNSLICGALLSARSPVGKGKDENYIRHDFYKHPLPHFAEKLPRKQRIAFASRHVAVLKADVIALCIRYHVAHRQEFGLDVC